MPPPKTEKGTTDKEKGILEVEKGLRQNPAHIVILDVANNKALSGVRTVRIGERVELAISVTPPEAALSNITWTIPNGILDYGVCQNEARVQQLTKDDLSNQTVTWYWFKPQTYRVSVAAQVSGTSVSQVGDFNVIGPKLTPRSFTGKTTKVTIGPSNVVRADDSQPTSFGFFDDKVQPPTAASAGIRWEATISLPEGCGGWCAWFQLVKSTRTYTPADGSAVQTTRVDGIDNAAAFDAQRRMIPNTAGIFYGPQIGPLLNVAATIKIPSRDDSPQIELTKWKKASADEKFKVFLMYNPDTPGSIWVPLGLLEWEWKGTAEVINGKWTMTNPSHSKNPRGKSTTRFPEWKG